MIALAGGLAGTVALVTGGSSGIGRAVVTELSGLGSTVISVARRPPDVPPGGGAALTLDLERPGSGAEAVEHVVTAYGRLDLLVVNAGVMLVDDVLSARMADWQTMIALNLAAATDCARAALPHLVTAARDSPRSCADLVLVGSLSSRVPTPGRAMYAATKAALRAFADVARMELAETAVRLTLLEPGLTDTGLRARNPPATLTRMARRTPSLAGVRPLDPADVAQAVGWAVSRPSGVTIGELTVLPTSQGR
ncbi:SDR family oxidoreductase [Actinoallomurus acaciae]|uniref:SDR family oxidoreductase n=1 Tax=Actinoallomurus acaciae TaxID=502577 RepID=A0ABV5YBB1_9ACTN